VDELSHPFLPTALRGLNFMKTKAYITEVHKGNKDRPFVAFVSLCSKRNTIGWTNNQNKT
jgi:hypothetical protein